MSTCKDCGNPISECSDRHRVWYPQRMVCFATMERAAADRAYAELHEDKPFHDGTFRRWAKERTTSTPYHYSDGVTLMASAVDHAPGDLFTTRADAAPWDEAE